MPQASHKKAQPVSLDPLDVPLLDLLQHDASLPMRTLADKVATSPATCQRRIAQLRETGVLQRPVAIVDRRLVGRPLTIRRGRGCLDDGYVPETVPLGRDHPRPQPPRSRHLSDMYAAFRHTPGKGTICTVPRIAAPSLP